MLLPASDGEAELAGFDVAAYRSWLTRAFVESLRWTDLTASSAQPRSTPIAGYAPLTIVHGSSTTGDITKAILDPARCTDAGQCTWNQNLTLDCSSDVMPKYSVATDVMLSTDDGAMNQVFRSAVQLQAGMHNPGTALSVLSSVDVAEVQGTLRIEPLPGVQFGWLAFASAFFANRVRGRLVLDLNNDWMSRIDTGRDLEPIEDRPLMASFPADDCDIDTLPAALDEPNAALSVHSPFDEIAALRSRVAATDTLARWSHTGAETSLLVEIDTPEYACVTPGRISNVPLRLSTADGTLDWSVLAAHDIADEAAQLPHRISFDQELIPGSKVWNQVFGAFQLAPDAERIFVRFRAEYPARGSDGALSSTPGRAVLDISESPHCRSKVFPCSKRPLACVGEPPDTQCFTDP